MSLKLIFAGTPEFAAIALRAIYEAKFKIQLVLTQPDRPSGRGMHLTMSAVKQFALAKQLDLHQPISLNLASHLVDSTVVQNSLNLIQNTAHDLMVVAAYGLILPEYVLNLSRYGCINIHASLLPRWRGAAPIQRAIEAGDATTGICIMKMDASLDTGPIIAEQSLPILPSSTSASMHINLAKLGASMIVNVLQHLEKFQSIPATPQNIDFDKICYAKKIHKNEAYINFNLPAAVLARRIMAFNPNPGMHFIFGKHRIKVWEAYETNIANIQNLNEICHAAGTVLAVTSDGVYVACQNSILCLTSLQLAGNKLLPLASFLKSFPLSVGQKLI